MRSNAVTKTFVGLAVQSPYAELLVSGAKTVETRNYNLPEKYVGKKLLIIQTPGSNKTKKSTVIGWVEFDKPYRYESEKDFGADYQRHLVKRGSRYYWNGKTKWAWPVKQFKAFSRQHKPSKRVGIKFTTGLIIPRN